jgi:hypothetical protein
MYAIYWNGKRINTARTVGEAKQTIAGIQRDYGPLAKGTLAYRKECVRTTRTTDQSGARSERNSCDGHQDKGMGEILGVEETT